MTIPTSVAEALSDRYVLSGEIAQGGMSTVYLAQDLRHSRRVAIKVLKSELAAALGAERFLREIKLTAQLNHPHILPLLDSGSAAGMLYYVMPFVEGETLRQRLDRAGRLPFAEVLLLARDMADALDSAHRHGVVHRDIKPENILIREGHAVLSDFGIAHVLAEASSEKITGTGIVVGSPRYMSPEQASGESDLDGRSDQYSLACVLYEALVGEPPFSGNSAQAVISRHVSHPAPDVASRASLPKPAAAAITRALAKSPSWRFETAGAFEAALGAAEAPPSSARSLLSSARAWMSARPLVLTTALVGLITVAFVGVRLWSSSQVDGKIERARSGSEVWLAVLPFESQGSDSRSEYFAQGIHQEILEHLGMIGSLHVKERASVMKYRDPSIPNQVIGQQLGVDFVLRTKFDRDSLRVRLVSQLIDARTNDTVWKHSYDRAPSSEDLAAVRMDLASHVAQALEVGISAAERARISGHPTASRVAYHLFLEASQHLYRQERPANDSAKRLLEDAIGLDSGFASAWAELAEVHFARSYTLGLPRSSADSARRYAEEAVRLDSTLPAGHRVVALSHLDQGHLGEAANGWNHVLAMRPNDGDALLGLGWIELLRGRLAGATAYLTQARAIDPSNITVVLDLLVLSRLFGNSAQTERLMEDASGLAMDSRYIAGSNPIPVQRLLMQGRDAEALALAKRLTDSLPEDVAALTMAAMVYSRLGSHALARPLYAKLAKLSGPDWNGWGLTYRTNYAFTLRQLGERRTADSLLEDTRRDAEGLIARKDVRPGIRRELAAILSAQGHAEGALVQLDSAVKAGWRLERIHPSPFLESAAKTDPRFRSLLDGMERDIAQQTSALRGRRS